MRPCKQLRTCAIRPHLIWGPRDPHLVPRVLASAQAGKLLRIGNGENRVDITFVDNAAWAHVLAMDDLTTHGRAAGKAYFIGDARPVVLWDWINSLLDELGMQPVRRGIPLWLARRLGAVLELVYTVFPALGEPRLTRFVATQMGTSHYFSHERARLDIGYEPLVDSAAGMQQLLAWLREQKPGHRRLPAPAKSS